MLSPPLPSLSMILRFFGMVSTLYGLCLSMSALPDGPPSDADSYQCQWRYLVWALSCPLPTMLTQVVRKPFPNSYHGQVKCRQDNHSSMGLCYHRAPKIFDGKGKEVRYSLCMSPVTWLISDIQTNLGMAERSVEVRIECLTCNYFLTLLSGKNVALRMSWYSEPTQALSFMIPVSLKLEVWMN